MIGGKWLCERAAGGPVARFAFRATALGLACGIHAAGLFLPVGPAGAAADVAPGARSAPARQGASTVSDAWERRVRITRHELTAARADVDNAGAGRLLLNVRDGARLDVVVERTAPTRWGYSLSGRVVGGGAGFATLVVHEEAVAASIWTPDYAYELTYLGGGVHALRDVTDAPRAECGGALPSELSAADASAEGAADDGSVVDILVVWTPATEEMYGGEAQVLSKVEMLIAYTNDAFERSGALVSLALVGAEKVDYLEDDFYVDLQRLVDTDDGHMDSVHDRRNELGADLVHLLTTVDPDTRRGAGGVASGAFSFNSTFDFEAHYNFITAHEIGHNFGILHDRYEVYNTRLRAYQHGFATRSCHVTIMSYFTSCRRGSRGYQPVFASPWRYSLRGGRALGVSRFSKERGARGPADAVLTLNRNRHRVAIRRPSRNGE